MSVRWGEAAALEPLWIEATFPRDVMALYGFLLVGLRLVSPTRGGGPDVSPLDVAIPFWTVIGCGEGVAGEERRQLIIERCLH